MTVHILWFLGASVVVIAAGIWLSRTADAIAEHTGLGRLTVGVVLLAGATTLPEIVTDLSAIRQGQPDLAVGDILGSCLMNLLILGLLDLLHHVRHGAGLVSRIVIGHTRAATLSIVLMAIAGAGLATHFRPSVGPFGLSTLVLVVVYLLGMRIATRQGEAVGDTPGLTPEAGGATMSLRAALVGFGLGALALVLMGPHLAHSGEAIATATGLGTSFFGAIFLAFVTSLPELVASLTALRLGAHDLAVGNIFGSNVFNVALLFVFDAAQGPGALLAVVSQTHVITALVVILVTGLAVISLLAREERRVWLVEPDAAMLLLAGFLGIGLIYLAR